MMLRSANNGPKIAYVFMLLNYHDLFTCMWDRIFSKVILCFQVNFMQSYKWWVESQCFLDKASMFDGSYPIVQFLKQFPLVSPHSW